MRSLRRILACALSLAAFAALAAARAEEDCGEIERNYQLIKTEAVSVQTNTALFAAADRGCEALARKLLDAGASLLARDRRGAMPLAHAAREGRVRLVELFLADGAPVDARNVDGGTALFAAAEGQKHSTVALLLDKGADPNLAGRSGLTPLMAAAFKGNDRIVEILLAHGAETSARDATGKFFTLERLIRLVREIGARPSAKEIVGRIVEAVKAFQGSAEQHDDVTVVALKRR